MNDNFFKKPHADVATIQTINSAPGILCQKNKYLYLHKNLKANFIVTLFI